MKIQQTQVKSIQKERFLGAWCKTTNLNGVIHAKISKSLENVALIMEVDGELKDLSYTISTDVEVKIITSKDKNKNIQVIKMSIHSICS